MQVFARILHLGDTWWRMGFDGGVWELGGAVLKVFPAGSWMVPCWISDGPCREKYESRLEPEEWADLDQIAGYHRFASIWG